MTIFSPSRRKFFSAAWILRSRLWSSEEARLFIHCAAGVHRAPMMTLAVLCSQGWDLAAAMETISSRRPLADFAEVYVESVEKFLQQQGTQEIGKPLIE